VLDEDRPAEPDDPPYGEPDPEPDPEADLPDPESELPPSVEVPAPDSGDVPDELAREFWVTVLVFNAALLSVAVGVLMVAFDVERPLGLGLAVLGLLLVRRGYRLYRSLDERHRAGELTVDDDEPPDDNATDDGPPEDPAPADAERNG